MQGFEETFLYPLLLQTLIFINIYVLITLFFSK